MNKFKKQIENYKSRKEALVAKKTKPNKENGSADRSTGDNIEEWYKR